MVVSFKDALKIFGVAIICACAVFVCTFMLNFFIDVQSIKHLITDEAVRALYDAQVMTAKFTSAICGGVLGVVAIFTLMFYIKLFVDSHARELGVLKAMGYRAAELSLRFAVFGLSVFLGACVGYVGGIIIMPTVYGQMLIEGLPEVSIRFHWELLIGLVFAPTVLFSVLSCLYAGIALRRPATELLKGKSKQNKGKVAAAHKEKRSFLVEMCLSTLRANKGLAFFTAFASFCFAAMVQMAFSMKKLNTETMGYIILLIGLVLAITTLFMALTALINGNAKNLALMKVMGYSVRERAVSVLAIYSVFVLIGFAVGTVYQFGLLKIMVSLVYRDVAFMPEYHFDVATFFVTLAACIIGCVAVTAYYVFKIDRISVKSIMQES